MAANVYKRHILEAARKGVDTLVTSCKLWERNNPKDKPPFADAEIHDVTDTSFMIRVPGKFAPRYFVVSIQEKQ